MTQYRLVLAEKPSVAKSISSVLGAKKHEDGFYIGNGYIVSCVFRSSCWRNSSRHLAELSDAETYDEKFGKWRYEDLPIIPSPWQYSVSRDKKKQLDLLRNLMHRADVCEVINACDAGREGELIFRTVYNLNGCTKPMKRLWISSMEENAIAEGFENLRDGKEYDNLFASALCRSKADWLVGINATRLFSVLYHRTLNVGRVISPTLALLVEREAEISAFQSEPFYTVNLDFGAFSATGEKCKTKAEAEKVREQCKSDVATVVKVERKEKSEKAPALYDLTTLQRDANRMLGYTAQQALDYLQSLYEKKLTTYPRTDSRYLTDDMESNVRALVICAAGIADKDVPVVAMLNQVCDSSKVSDHHAIIPTMRAGETELSTLPVGEREILVMIAMQALKAVSEAHRYTETVVTLRCGDAEFTVKGKCVTNFGWRGYFEQEKTDMLPEITEGRQFAVRGSEIKEGKTTPPKHYTEDTLLSAMEVAGATYRAPTKSQDFVGKGGATERGSFSPSGENGRSAVCDDAPEDAERKGIGTPATRASVIEKLIEGGFVERRKAKKTVSLIPVPVGVSLITVLPEQLQSPLLTAEWEHKLKQIEHGEMDSDAFLSEITEMVSELVRDCKAVPGAEVLFPSGRPVVGKCPRCGSDVTESKMGYFCEKNDCKFGLWRDNKFLSGKKINLTKKMVTSLLKDGRTYASGIYSEKTGKTYDAFVVLEDDGVRSTYKLDFTK